MRAQLREEIRRDAQLHLSALETSTLLFSHRPDPYFLEETGEIVAEKSALEGWGDKTRVRIEV